MLESKTLRLHKLVLQLSVVNQSPVTFPNVQTSDPFQFPHPPFYGKGDQFSGFPPQSNVGSFKSN